MSFVQPVQGYKSATVNTSGDASSTTALALNPRRIAWGIQNQGQNVLYVKLGASASNSDYTWTISGGTADEDGTGGSLNFDGNAIWKGVISVSGVGPKYSVYEILEEN